MQSQQNPHRICDEFVNTLKFIWKSKCQELKKKLCKEQLGVLCLKTQKCSLRHQQSENTALTQCVGISGLEQKLQKHP